jgi:hypothetical protein
LERWAHVRWLNAARVTKFWPRAVHTAFGLCFIQHSAAAAALLLVLRHRRLVCFLRGFRWSLCVLAVSTLNSGQPEWNPSTCINPRPRVIGRLCSEQTATAGHAKNRTKAIWHRHWTGKWLCFCRTATATHQHYASWYVTHPPALPCSMPPMGDWQCQYRRANHVPHHQSTQRTPSERPALSSTLSLLHVHSAP